MSIFQNYIVCYDIECNKKRKKFFNDLKALGLIPIQKSVFYGQLNKAEFNAMKRLALNLLSDDEDKCIWLKTDLKEINHKESIGYKNIKLVAADGFFTI